METSVWVDGSLMPRDEARALVLAAAGRLARVGRARHVQVAVAKYVIANIEAVLDSRVSVEQLLVLDRWEDGSSQVVPEPLDRTIDPMVGWLR